MGLNRSTQRGLEQGSIRRGSIPQSATRAQRPNGKPNHKRVRILIVDDEEDLCRIVSQVLSENGYLADTTLTACEAIEKIKKTYYNLVITDVKLPDRNGIELLELIEEASPDTSVIILTAFPEVETAIRALNHGAFSYLTKPFTNEELLNVVRRAVARQNAASRSVQLLRRLRRKNEELERLSNTDALTGLYNRTYFEEILGREEMRIQRYRRPVAIVMVDINELKHINDHFGHLKGDMVIKETAKLLRNMCRGSDIVARYGGDEFIILLPETTEEGASSLTRSLKKAVRRWNLCNTDRGLNLNLSFGYACAQNGASLIDVLNQADANMYQDKMSQKALDHCQRKKKNSFMADY